MKRSKFNLIGLVGLSFFMATLVVAVGVTNNPVQKFLVDSWAKGGRVQTCEDRGSASVRNSCKERRKEREEEEKLAQKAAWEAAQAAIVPNKLEFAETSFLSKIGKGNNVVEPVVKIPVSPVINEKEKISARDKAAAEAEAKKIAAQIKARDKLEAKAEKEKIAARDKAAAAEAAQKAQAEQIRLEARRQEESEELRADRLVKEQEEKAEKQRLAEIRVRDEKAAAAAEKTRVEEAKRLEAELKGRQALEDARLVENKARLNAAAAEKKSNSYLYTLFHGDENIKITELGTTGLSNGNTLPALPQSALTKEGYKNYATGTLISGSTGVIAGGTIYASVAPTILNDILSIRGVAQTLVASDAIDLVATGIGCQMGNQDACAAFTATATIPGPTGSMNLIADSIEDAFKVMRPRAPLNLSPLSGLSGDFSFPTSIADFDMTPSVGTQVDTAIAKVFNNLNKSLQGGLFSGPDALFPENTMNSATNTVDEMLFSVNLDFVEERMWRNAVTFEQDLPIQNPNVFDPEIRVRYQGRDYPTNSVTEAEQIAFRLTGIPVEIKPEMHIQEPNDLTEAMNSGGSEVRVEVPAADAAPAKIYKPTEGLAVITAGDKIEISILGEEPVAYSPGDSIPRIEDIPGVPDTATGTLIVDTNNNTFILVNDQGLDFKVISLNRNKNVFTSAYDGAANFVDNLLHPGQRVANNQAAIEATLGILPRGAGNQEIATALINNGFHPDDISSDILGNLWFRNLAQHLTPAEHAYNAVAASFRGQSPESATEIVTALRNEGYPEAEINEAADNLFREVRDNDFLSSNPGSKYNPIPLEVKSETHATGEKIATYAIEDNSISLTVNHSNGGIYLRDTENVGFRLIRPGEEFTVNGQNYVVSLSGDNPPQLHRINAGVADTPQLNPAVIMKDIEDGKAKVFSDSGARAIIYNVNFDDTSLAKVFKDPSETVNVSELKFMKEFGGQVGIPSFKGELPNGRGYVMEKIPAVQLYEFKGNLTKAEVNNAIDQLKQIHATTKLAHGDIGELNILVETLADGSHQIHFVDFLGDFPDLRTTRGMDFDMENLTVSLEKYGNILPFAFDPKLIQENSDLIVTPGKNKAFNEVFINESVGGNAGDGYAAINGAIDRNGKIISFGNIQDIPSEVVAKLRNGEAYRFSVNAKAFPILGEISPNYQIVFDKDVVPLEIQNVLNAINTKINTSFQPTPPKPPPGFWSTNPASNRTFIIAGVILTGVSVAAAGAIVYLNSLLSQAGLPNLPTFTPTTTPTGQVETVTPQPPTFPLTPTNTAIPPTLTPEALLYPGQITVVTAPTDVLKMAALFEQAVRDFEASSQTKDSMAFQEYLIKVFGQYDPRLLSDKDFMYSLEKTADLYYLEPNKAVTCISGGIFFRGLPGSNMSNIEDYPFQLDLTGADAFTIFDLIAQEGGNPGKNFNDVFQNNRPTANLKVNVGENMAYRFLDSDFLYPGDALFSGIHVRAILDIEIDKNDGGRIFYIAESNNPQSETGVPNGLPEVKKLTEEEFLALYGGSLDKVVVLRKMGDYKNPYDPFRDTYPSEFFPTIID